MSLNGELLWIREMFEYCPNARAKEKEIFLLYCFLQRLSHPNQKLLLVKQNHCNEKTPPDKLEILCIILNLYGERNSTFLEQTSR